MEKTPWKAMGVLYGIRCFFVAIISLLPVSAHLAHCALDNQRVRVRACVCTYVRVGSASVISQCSIQGRNAVGLS